MAIDLKPWRKADNFAHFNLYWLPVRAFPFPSAQRAWIFRFVTEFVARVADLHQLEPEFLLRDSAIAGSRQEQFASLSRKHVPLRGLCRNPDEPIKPTPTLEDLKPVQRGDKEFKMSDYAPEYCYWLAARRLPDALRDFGGYGGASIVFHPKDPNSLPPNIPPIQAFRGDPQLGPDQLQAHMNVLFALRAAFLPQSKAVFGRGLESHPQFPDLPFIIPRWNAQLYVGARPELVAEWLSVFPIQLVESAEDGGFLLASAPALDELLQSLTADLEQESLTYRA